MPSRGLSKYNETAYILDCRPRAFNSFKDFLKEKKGSGTTISYKIFDTNSSFHLK